MKVTRTYSKDGRVAYPLEASSNRKIMVGNQGNIIISGYCRRVQQWAEVELTGSDLGELEKLLPLAKNMQAPQR